MHAALMIASRLIAVTVASTAFYFAFFVYEDEEGQWQNRLEKLWFSIYDRAKLTDSTSVALFNKVGSILENFFQRIFGKELISFRTLGISINLSLICGLLSFRLCPWIASNVLKDTVSLRLIFLGVFLSGALATVGIVFQRPWSALVVNIPTFLAVLPLLTVAGHLNAPSAEERAVALEAFWNLAAYGLSFLSDFVAIIVVRKIVSRLSTGLSAFRLILAICALAVLSGLLEFGPLIFRSPLLSAKYSSGAQALIRAQASILQRLNLSSSIFCLVPLLFLLLVLAHRLIWPFLSRLVYPVAARKVISNRKLLIGIGSLALLHALNIEEVSLKSLIGLFGGGSE